MKFGLPTFIKASIFLIRNFSMMSMSQSNSKPVINFLRIFYGILFIGSGVSHFVTPDFYESIVPEFLPECQAAGDCHGDRRNFARERFLPTSQQLVMRRGR